MEYPFNQAQQHHRRDEDERPNTYPPPGISSTYSDVPKPEAHLLHSSHVTSEHMSQDFDYSAPPPSAPFDHRPHGYPPAPAAADYSCHKVTTALSSKPTVRVLAKADPNFSPTIRHGQVILAPSNPTNEYQHCYEDEKYSTRVKDEEATGEALKHSVGATHPGTESKVCGVESTPVTLLIKHLPEAIPHDTLSRILANFGASSMRPCSSGRLRNCAFVDFKNEMAASQAQRQINGLRFLGKVLSAQRASNPTENGEKSSGAQWGKDSKTSMMKNTNVTIPIDGDTKSGGLPIPEPIADRLGVNYPFPPHLEYAYPPPDGNILTNIVNALIAVPRFYTQVLHLMNKMNIPAPFRMALPTPPLPPEVPAPPPPPPPTVTANPRSAYLSSGESEMESSDEEDEARTKKSGQKRARRETIVGPAIDKGVAHESVGVKPATLVPKEIPVIKKNPVLKINIVPKTTLNEHKDDDTTQELQEPEDVADPNKFLTPDELERGKLPPEEILSLPMFKNYSAGNPAPVLYIKNLAKDVIADDFYLVFGSLFGSVEAAKSGILVKLMQEGRMRGQAFLTFPSIELAHHALNLVNGYVLKGKPMIIQFGRNPAAAK